MQIGIDVGATKIETVVLEPNGQEKHRSRTACPKDYLSIINAIKDISQKLEKEFKIELPHVDDQEVKTHLEKTTWKGKEAVVSY